MPTVFETVLSNALMAAALAVLAAVVGRACRRPAVAHSLWLLVLVKLLTPPLVPVPVRWPGGPERVAEPAVAHAEPLSLPEASQEALPASLAGTEAPSEAVVPPAAAAPLEAVEPLSVPPTVTATAPAVAAMPPPEALHQAATFPWGYVLGAVWLAGSVWWFGLVALRVRRFQRLLRMARPAPERLHGKARRLAALLGLARCPSVWLVPGRVSPLLWAFGGRPRLLVPAALWERLDDREQDTLLAHELAHLRRGDPWVRGLELLVTGLYWWHPVVWWACREIREAEEQCCDAWVVWALPAAARAYATALVETVDFLSETQTALPVAASGIGHIHDLRRRLTMIMRGTTPRALSAGGLLAVLGLGALLLPLWPSWAQPPDEDGAGRRDARPGDERREAEQEDRRQEGQRGDGRRNDGDDGLDRARDEVRQMAQEIEKVHHQLEVMMQRLDQAKKRLAEQEVRRSQRQQPNEPRRAPGERRDARGSSGSRDPEQRLMAVEKKLDTVLEELQSLRREMRRSGGWGGGGLGGGRAGRGGQGGMMGGGMPGMGGMMGGPGMGGGPGMPGAPGMTAPPAQRGRSGNPPREAGAPPAGRRNDRPERPQPPAPRDRPPEAPPGDGPTPREGPDAEPPPPAPRANVPGTPAVPPPPAEAEKPT